MSNTFTSNARLKLAKNHADANQHLEAELWYLKINCFLYLRYQSRIIWHILKNKQKNKRVCINGIIWLIIRKMKMKKKKISHKHNINKRSSKHGRKYSKCKKFLSIMKLICIKQHLSNIWSSVHEKATTRLSWKNRSL